MRCSTCGLTGTIVAHQARKRVLIRLDGGSLLSIHRKFVTLLHDDSVQPEVSLVESVTRVCLGCGQDISHLRPQAKTCSAKCRKSASRM